MGASFQGAASRCPFKDAPLRAPPRRWQAADLGRRSIHRLAHNLLGIVDAVLGGALPLIRLKNLRAGCILRYDLWGTRSGGRGGGWGRVQLQTCIGPAARSAAAATVPFAARRAAACSNSHSSLGTGGEVYCSEGLTCRTAWARRYRPNQGASAWHARRSVCSATHNRPAAQAPLLCQARGAAHRVWHGQRHAHKMQLVLWAQHTAHGPLQRKRGWGL
jgi:hypothetical protein